MITTLQHAERRAPVHVPPGEGWEPVTVGESDTNVYRRGDVFAKCCGTRGVAELREERDRVEWLARTELPAASVVDWAESADGACLVTTAVAGVAGTELPKDAFVRAMQSLGKTLRELHELPDCPFEHRLADVIDQAADVVRRGAVNPAFLTDEWRALEPGELLNRVLAERPYAEARAADDLVVCHGDACLPNIFFDPVSLKVTGLIDLGRLGIADRYADLAVTTIQLHDEWSADPTPFFNTYGLAEPDFRRLEFYRLLDPLTWG